jgi:hypothetical protein
MSYADNDSIKKNNTIGLPQLAKPIWGRQNTQKRSGLFWPYWATFMIEAKGISRAECQKRMYEDEHRKEFMSIGAHSVFGTSDVLLRRKSLSPYRTKLLNARIQPPSLLLEESKHATHKHKRNKRIHTCAPARKNTRAHFSYQLFASSSTFK